MSIDTIVQEPDTSKQLSESTTSQPTPPPVPPGRKRSHFYTGVLAAGLVGYITLQLTLKVMTDFQIYRVQVREGKAASVEYATSLWKEIHPEKETVIGNVLYVGKKSAVLEYLGYRKLDSE